MEFKPRFLAMAIGSMPHQQTAEAVEQILLNFERIPFWPQLPKRCFLESMYVQFSQGLPGILINQDKKTIYVDSQQAEEQLEECYQHYLADDTDYFAISSAYAPGFYTLLDRLKEHEQLSCAKASEDKPENGPEDKQATNNEQRYIKGQITGPVSFGLTVTDENKRALIYNPLLAEALVKVLVMKAKWQIRKLTAHNSKLKAIIFIDEPYLSSVGSAYVSLKKEDIVKYSDEIIEAIHAAGALAGIHCCGDTDWSIILDTKTDIVSFDAYNYIGSLSLYAQELKGFLGRGGVLAWGVVPASEDVGRESAESLTQKLERGIDLLTEKGLEKERIVDFSLITPSCGTGTLSIELAENVFRLTRHLSEAMRKKLQ